MILAAISNSTLLTVLIVLGIIVLILVIAGRR